MTQKLVIEVLAPKVAEGNDQSSKNFVVTPLRSVRKRATGSTTSYNANKAVVEALETTVIARSVSD